MTRIAAAILSTLLLLSAGGCASERRGADIVDDEITAIIDLLGAQDGSRRFELESANRLNCDQEGEDDRYETRRAFRTSSSLEQDVVVDQLVDHYRAVGADLYQHRQEPGPTIRLQAAERRRKVFVELSIDPQGQISPGSVYFTPCGIDFLPGAPPPSFIEEEPGT